MPRATHPSRMQQLARTLTMADAEQLLHDIFALPSFRAGQREVIDALLAGHSALAVFPTGGGKSLCYQLPALAFDGVTVVVSPLIALMKDQIDALRARGIAAARLDSTLDANESREVTARLRNGSLKLLYVAPERFNNERFVDQLGRTQISLFAIDEAHCISEWGHNFRPDYLKLAETARSLKVERVLALTATATPAVRRDIQTAFGIADEHAVVTGFYRPNLEIRTTAVANEQRDAVLVERLRARPPGTTIVYVTLQDTAERVAERLAKEGFPARAYHAGLENEVRSAVQDWWSSSDRAVVVATIAFGMGIDKADVRYVYHYNLPKSLESYSQEIGRAGRDGAPSIVEMFACLDDVAAIENFAYGDTPSRESLEGLIRELAAAGDEFDVSPFDLSSRHDIRPLVLRTAFTYLELLGWLKQGTPVYASYEARLIEPLPTIVAKFEGERATFIRTLFETAKKGRIWFTIRPDEFAAAHGGDRTRVQKALTYLEENGWIELKAADLRQRFRWSKRDPNVTALSEELASRFGKRESQEIARVAQVLELVTHEGCQTNALVGYFGEIRATPCGHCSYCMAGQRVRLPDPASLPPIESQFDRFAFDRLRDAHRALFADPRRCARFLCGLSSPAFTRAKLGRHALFGALATRRFGEVLRAFGG